MLRWIVLAAALAMHAAEGISAEEQEAGLPRFMLDYALARNLIPESQHLGDEMFELSGSYPAQAEIIFGFWHRRAAFHCRDFLAWETEVGDVAKRQDEILESTRWCLRGYYFDNRDEIAVSIRSALSNGQRIATERRELPEN